MYQSIGPVSRHRNCGLAGKALLNRIEHGIRCYDPCLSCSTHAAGQMALHLRLLAPDGTLLHERTRD